MEGLLFVESKLMSGVYHNAESHIELATHVDGFIAVGLEDELHKLYDSLNKIF